MSRLRVAVESRSAVLLLVLTRQPRWLVALGVLALFAGVLGLPDVAASLCLALLLAFVGWLSYLSWPALPGRARAVRVLSWVVLLGLGVAALG